MHPAVIIIPIVFAALVLLCTYLAIKVMTLSQKCNRYEYELNHLHSVVSEQHERLDFHTSDIARLEGRYNTVSRILKQLKTQKHTNSTDDIPNE